MGLGFWGVCGGMVLLFFVSVFLFGIIIIST